MIAVSRQRHLAGAAAIMMAAYVASRLSGLVRDVAISYQFGTGRQLDAYLAGMRIPDLVFQIAAGGAVAGAFIPVYAQYLSRDSEAERWRMVSTLYTLALVVLTPIIIALIIFAPNVIDVMAPQFPPADHALAANLARILLIAPLFFTFGTFATSILNAHGRFFLSALAPTTYNLGIIVGAVVFSRWLGIYGLALGALLGACGFLLVQIPGLLRLGLVYRPALQLSHPGVRAVGRLMAPRALGLAVTQINFVATLFLASGIAGGIAALNYAWLLTMLPLGVFAMAISTAVFPSLAEQAAQSERAAMARTVKSTLRFILYLTIPSSIGLIVLGPHIVRLLFQHGRFTAHSTDMTASALRFYAIGLTGMAAIEIVTRAFYAMHDTKTPVLVALSAAVVNVTLGVLLVGPLGHVGLALATGIASLAEAAILITLASRRLPDVTDRSIAVGALKSFAASLVMGAVVASVVVAMAGWDGIASGSIVTAGALLAGVVVYIALTTLLGAGEVGRLRRIIAKA